jgi:hypothetical protein
MSTACACVFRKWGENGTLAKVMRLAALRESNIATFIPK